MSHTGLKALLVTGFLCFITAQVIGIDLCRDMSGTVDSNPWQQPSVTFHVNRDCEWGDKSLILMLEGYSSDYRVTLQGETFSNLRTRACFVISMNYNTSSNPTESFPNCKRIIWMPLKYVSVVVTSWSRQLSYQYKFTSAHKITSTHTGAPTVESSNGAVIALAVLFTLALIAVFILLIILFKERVVELSKDIRSRFDKPSKSAATPTPNAVYAVAEEPSIYHEVGTANQREVVQNELYAMT